MYFIKESSSLTFGHGFVFFFFLSRRDFEVNPFPLLKTFLKDQVYKKTNKQCLSDNLKGWMEMEGGLYLDKLKFQKCM